MQPVNQDISKKRSHSDFQAGEDSQITKKSRKEAKLNQRVSDLIQAINLKAQSLDWNNEVENNNFGRFLATFVRENPCKTNQLWSAVFEKLNSPTCPIAFASLSFGQGCICTLPKSLWLDHSPSFGNMIASQMGDAPIIIEENQVPLENRKVFILCLQNGSLYLEELNNLLDVFYLANKYQVEWLKIEVADFLLMRADNFYRWNVLHNPLGEFLFNTLQQFLNFSQEKWLSLFKFIQTQLGEKVKNKGNLLNPEELGSIRFEHGYTCTLPIALWKKHGGFLYSLFEFSRDGEKNLPKELNIPSENVRAFIDCLENCNTNSINLSNYRDVYKLADKYEIHWLMNNYNYIYEACGLASILANAVEDKMSKTVLSIISRIINEGIVLPLGVLSTLKQIAEENVLAALKFALLCKRGLDISMSMDDGFPIIKLDIKIDDRIFEGLANILKISSWLPSPKIELVCPGDTESVKNAVRLMIMNERGLLKVLVKADSIKYLLSKCIEYSVEHVKLEINDCEVETFSFILDFMKENIALKSIDLTVNDRLFYYNVDEFRDIVTNYFDNNKLLKEVNIRGVTGFYQKTYEISLKR